MKHAYLVIAHNEPQVLAQLVSTLDDDRNDFFIHIDAKSDFEIMTKNICSQKSKLFFVNRHDIRWGDISQLETEFELFTFALKSGKYDYFHLLSGVDLPIKRLDYICNFFENNAGKEFVEVNSDSNTIKNELYNKCLCYNFFAKHLKGDFGFFFRAFRFLLCKIQRFFKIQRHYPFLLYKGSNWVSISLGFCEYLVSLKEEILKNFKYTCCADEIFLQSVLMSSPFKDNIYVGGNLRFIDWHEGNSSPKTFTVEDFDNIRNSTSLFARKFNSSDKELLRLLKDI